jgi:hypothetical protein
MRTCFLIWRTPKSSRRRAIRRKPQHHSKMPSKKKTPAKKKAPPVAAATACSPFAPPMIRLVIQLVDTPHNRAVMDSIHAAAKAAKVQGPHAALKREDVIVHSLLTTPRPPENR